MPARTLIVVSIIVALGTSVDVQAQQRRSQNGQSPQRRSTSYRQQQQRSSRSRGRENVAARPQRRGQQKEGTVKQEVLTTIFSQIVAGGLNNPSGVAIQPKSGEVFISDSGAARIVRLHDVPDQYQFIPVITGFPVEEYGKGPKYTIGPLGLAFLNKYTLVVGGGGLPDGKELVRIYRVPHAGSIDAGDMLNQLGPLAPSPEFHPGEGNFYGVVATENELYVTCNGDDTKGWIAKAPITDGEPGELAPFIKTKEIVDVDAPTAIAMGRRGQLIVSQMGEVNIPNDSRLTFYDPNNGELLLDVPTQLHDVVGVAISPQTGRIYAVDFSWIAPEEGGLYRLDLGKDEEEWICKPTLLMPLDRPSAMAFAEDGELFITTFGSHTGEHKGGLLVRIYNDSKL